MHADRIRFSLLVFLILAALPFGSSQDPWRWLSITAAGLVFCGFLWSGLPILLGRRERVAVGLGCAWLLWLGLQLLPMPPSLLAALSPPAHELHRISVPGAGGSDPRGYAWPAPAALDASSPAAQAAWIEPGAGALHPLSLYPWGTWRNLLQGASLVAFAIMVMSLFQDRRHQRWLCLTIAGLASFEAVYGSLELLTGHQHIFVYPKRFYGDSATGTLVNRNHYAALLNLALPLMVVLLMERGPARRTRLDFLPGWMRWKQIAASLRQPFLLSMVIVTGIAVVLSRSRMGLAALLAGLLSLTLLLAWAQRSSGRRIEDPAAPHGGARWRWALPMVFFAGICLYSLATDAVPTIERFLQVRGDLESDAMRPALWAESLPLVSGYVWTGAGSGAYPYALNPALARLPVADFWDYDHAHNDYIETFVTLGLIGTLLGGLALAIFMARRPATRYGLAALAAMVTLLVHSAVDFPLVIPANALLACAVMCLIALPDSPHAGREATVHGSARVRRVARGPARTAACIVLLAMVIVWPARSTVAAALAGIDHGNSGSPGDPARLRKAAALEPANDRHVRRLAQALTARAQQGPSDDIVLGDTLGQQARQARLEKLEALVAAHRELIRCLGLAPVDYSLHAEIARSASAIRALARAVGIPGPGSEGGGLMSPHEASVMLAPTAFDNHLAMATLLWNERRLLGEEAAARALDLLEGVRDRRRLWHDWKAALVRGTEDAPSLFRLDEAVRPGPEAYAGLTGAVARDANPDLADCAVVLKARATLRQAREAIEGRRIQNARGLLQAVINGAAAASPAHTDQTHGACGDQGLRLESLAEEARGLLPMLEGKSPDPS